jgi:phage terminase large subunit GpA-like protein
MLESASEDPQVSQYYDQLYDILEASRVKLSSLKPSEWAEQNIIMPKPFPGPLRYEKTPYTREIIDCFAPDHPARDIALMGSAQFGKTASIIIPAIGYIIANDPGNIIMTVGHEDLVAEAMDKIDAMLDTTGLRKLIKPTAQRVKAQKTGDTNTIKQFPNGYLKLSAASNPKIWRQTDYKFGLIDDYEAVKGISKTAGNQRDLIEKRFTAYATTYKRLFVSSPEVEQTSNILEVYKLGDQRKFVVPCPCCSVFIELRWSIEGRDGAMAGMTWKLDDKGNLIPESVGYICQECGGFFTDQNKSDYVGRGYWQPTAKPFRPSFYSYHMSSLYSPHGMTSWTDYVYKWLEAHPQGEPRTEGKYQTFLNLNLGEPYKATGEAPNANALQRNIRNYEIGTVPEKLSQRDGNGKIVLLTCACDLNGVEDDARLDYEVVAWSETGASYSITHGSIGTFIPLENTLKIKQDRERWTYHHNKPNSVWPKLRYILGSKIPADTGRNMQIFIAGIDCGHYTNHAYAFIDKPNVPRVMVVGLKGDKEGKYRRFGIDTPAIRPARERPNLYMVEVNQVKDDMAALIKLQWDSNNDPQQPPGFMNYPTPSGGMYLFNNYFLHYEAEHRVIETKEGEGIAAKWVKKTSAHQNHFFDVRVYNMAVRDILVALLCKELKMKTYGWADYVDILLRKVKVK